MRHTSRLGASLRYAFLSVVVLIFSFMLGRIAQGQSLSISSPEPPAQEGTQQGQAGLLPSWIEGVKVLAGKIGDMVAPARAVSLEVKNVSSLPLDVGVIRSALASMLLTDFKIDAKGVRVDVTLSENVEGLVWVAEIRAGEKGSRVAIVTIARPPARIDNAQNTSLVLTRRLVWEQEAKILDFAIVAGPPGSSLRLSVLGTEKLTFYRSVDARWKLEREISIPHSTPWPRDVSGWIDARENRAYIRGVVCAGNFQEPESVRCDPSAQNEASSKLKYTGHEEVVAGTIGPICGENMATLASGMTDLTQLDSIQGYLSVRGGRVMESGAPIEMDGPVIAMSPTEAPDAARAIVRNLRTGNYEGYVVSATCNH
jgi:hypothetical protein